MKHLSVLGKTLVRRAFMDGDTNIELPSWAFLVILVDIIIFLPAFVYVGADVPSLPRPSTPPDPQTVLTRIPSPRTTGQLHAREPLPGAGDG